MKKTAEVIAFPETTRERNKIRREATHRVAIAAKKLGYMRVNDQERELIELLRWTSFEGRDIVVKVAREMRQVKPWPGLRAK